MSVVQITDTVARGGGWTSERKGPVLELTNRRYRRRLVAWTNDPNDGPETILASEGCPQIGSTYALGNDADAIAVCIDVQVEPTDSPFVYNVTAQYDSSRVVDIGLSNPLNLPAEVTWTFTKQEIPLQRDFLGVPLVNSSKERFDPPLTTEVSRPVLTISRNEATYDEGNSILYQDATNLDVFGPAGIMEAKMSSISGRKMVDIGITYWKVDYEIEFDERTFALFVLDQGFRDINGKLFRDPVDNSPLANATLMNGRGFTQRDTYAFLDGAVPQFANTITVKNPPIYTGTQQPFNYFPPGPKAGTPHWYFEIKVDDEIMQVQGGFGTNTWLVQRGYSGTTPAAHADNAIAYLQPYFLRFIRFKQLLFAPLNLPTN
jgi:hypothetical protein